MRHYYKTIDGQGYLSLKDELPKHILTNEESGEELYTANRTESVDTSSYIEITEQEFLEATKPKELTEKQKAIITKQQRIAELKQMLRELDYIGVKIATGRATREEYTTEIALMSEYATEINQLEDSLGIKK